LADFRTLRILWVAIQLLLLRRTDAGFSIP
jgi:hypothetical protein